MDVFLDRFQVARGGGILVPATQQFIRPCHQSLVGTRDRSQNGHAFVEPVLGLGPRAASYAYSAVRADFVPVLITAVAVQLPAFDAVVNFFFAF